ncbi:hypothetical protein [Staphylococcus aureus]|nr:hypothetical protein [Staphylococcus aureus]
MLGEVITVVGVTISFAYSEDILDLREMKLCLNKYNQKEIKPSYIA